MKKFFVLFFILSTSVLVFFQNCSNAKLGTSNNNVGSESVKITPLVEESITTSMLISGPEVHTYKIMSDGSVLYKVDNGENFLVATLSSESLNFISQLIEQVGTVSPTLTSNNTGFICMDAPSSSYSIYNASNLKIKFSENVGCQDSYISVTAAYQLRSVMDGFSRLETNLAAVGGNIDGSKILFKSRSYGGYSLFGSVDRGVKVFYNGVIERYDGTTTHRIGQLSAAVLGNYISYASELAVIPPLYDANPGAPPCLDAPTTDFTLYKPNNTEVLLARLENCHTSVVNDTIPLSIKDFVTGMGSF